MRDWALTSSPDRARARRVVAAIPAVAVVSVRHCCRRERRAQLSARSDAELREDPVQVGADRAMREVQALADLAVRQPVRRKLGYLQFLRRQLIASLRHAAPATFPGR